jgi:hypothetical protein
VLLGAGRVLDTAPIANTSESLRDYDGFICTGGPSLARLLAIRLIIAIPAVILDDCRVGQAMFRSEELTEGKWLTLAVVQ